MIVTIPSKREMVDELFWDTLNRLASKLDKRDHSENQVQTHLWL